MHTLSTRTTMMLVASATLILAETASAQVLAGGAPAVTWPQVIEYGIDATATLGFGDPSTVHIALPAGRFRMAWFLNKFPRWAIEPAVSVDWSKVEDHDGALLYDVEVGGVYHITHFVVETKNGDNSLTTMWTPYVRPFIGVLGFSDGADRAQFVGGAGFGLKKPMKNDFAARFEVNGGWAFNPTNFRLGFTAGLSFFPH